MPSNCLVLLRSTSNGILPDLPNIFNEDYRNFISYSYTDRSCVFDSNRARFVATPFCRNRSRGRYKFSRVVEPRHKRIAPRHSLLQSFPTTGNEREEKREETRPTTGLMIAISRKKGKGALQRLVKIRVERASWTTFAKIGRNLRLVTREEDLKEKKTAAPVWHREIGIGRVARTNSRIGSIQRSIIATSAPGEKRAICSDPVCDSVH